MAERWRLDIYYEKACQWPQVKFSFQNLVLDWCMFGIHVSAIKPHRCKLFGLVTEARYVLFVLQRYLKPNGSSSNQYWNSFGLVLDPYDDTLLGVQLHYFFLLVLSLLVFSSACSSRQRPHIPVR